MEGVRIATRRPSAVLRPILALAVASIIALVALDSSRFSGALHHAGTSSAAVGSAETLALYLAGWALMMVAMMLPTAVTLLAAVGRLVDDGGRARNLQGAAAAGFLAAWMVIGYVFRAGDTIVHTIVDNVAWLAARPHLVAAGVLVLAGAYQFSSLKGRCLTACRMPTSFVYRHWHGGRPLGEAARIGVYYGISCVGCCWALMLVMFAVGTTNVAWMLLLGALMALEKNTAFGRRLTAPTGVALITGGVLVALAGG